MGAPRVLSRCLEHTISASATFRGRYKLGGGMWAGDEVFIVHGISAHALPSGGENVVNLVVWQSPPESPSSAFIGVASPVVLAAAGVGGANAGVGAIYLPGTPSPWPYDYWLTYEVTKNAGLQGLTLNFAIWGILQPRGALQAT